MRFFDFEWGREGDEKANTVMDDLKSPDGTMNASVQAVLMASTVTSRGRRMSPSSIFEALVNSKRRTNPFIVDQIHEAWNIMSDQATTTGDRVDVLISLITPKNRNKTGISEALRYQLLQTYESFLDFWIIVADMMTGFRFMSKQVFGVGDTVHIADYLHRGMTRSQLLRSFGHQLPEAVVDEPDEDSEESDE